MKGFLISDNHDTLVLLKLAGINGVVAHGAAETTKALSAALAAGDLETAQVQAHTIKGIAANLSLAELFKHILELENQIKAKSVDPNQFETVKTVFAATIIEIDKVIAENG